MNPKAAGPPPTNDRRHEKCFAILLNSKQVGPLSLRDLRHLLRTKQIVESCPVRRLDEEKWTRVNKLPELLQLSNAAGRTKERHATAKSPPGRAILTDNNAPKSNAAEIDSPKDSWQHARQVAVFLARFGSHVTIRFAKEVYLSFRLLLHVAYWSAGRAISFTRSKIGKGTTTPELAALPLHVTFSVANITRLVASFFICFTGMRFLGSHGSAELTVPPKPLTNQYQAAIHLAPLKDQFDTNSWISDVRKQSKRMTVDQQLARVIELTEPEIVTTHESIEIASEQFKRHAEVLFLTLMAANNGGVDAAFFESMESDFFAATGVLFSTALNQESYQLGSELFRAASALLSEHSASEAEQLLGWADNLRRVSENSAAKRKSFYENHKMLLNASDSDSPSQLRDQAEGVREYLGDGSFYEGELRKGLLMKLQELERWKEWESESHLLLNHYAAMFGTASSEYWFVKGKRAQFFFQIGGRHEEGRAIIAEWCKMALRQESPVHPNFITAHRVRDNLLRARKIPCPDCRGQGFRFANELGSTPTTMETVGMPAGRRRCLKCNGQGYTVRHY